MGCNLCQVTRYERNYMSSDMLQEKDRKSMSSDIVQRKMRAHYSQMTILHEITDDKDRKRKERAISNSREIVRVFQLNQKGGCRVRGHVLSLFQALGRLRQEGRRNQMIGTF